MSELPEGSNFYSALETSLPRERVAELFRSLGFIVRKCSWVDYEIRSDWAELVIEAEGPILMHGPIANIAVNVEKVLARLREAGIEYFGECYDENRELLQEFRWSNSR